MEEGPSKSQHGTLERRKLERVAGAIESDERDDAFRVEKDHLLSNVASHRLSDQDRLPVAHNIEQGDEILNGFAHRKRHSHGLRLAVSAHIPGEDAVMLADYRDLRIKGVVIDQRTVGEDNQGMTFLACEPVVQWTAFPLQNGGLDFFCCLHYWFLSPLISSNTYSLFSIVSFLVRSTSNKLLHCRFDVLVDVKEVGRIIPVLDLYQPLVVVAITGAYAGFTLI